MKNRKSLTLATWALSLVAVLPMLGGCDNDVDDIDDVADEVEDAADDAGDAIEDAVDDVADDLDDAT